MKVEVLEKDIDMILKNRGKDMFFILMSEGARSRRNPETGEYHKGKTIKRIIYTQVDGISIDKIMQYVDDDKYALIRVS